MANITQQRQGVGGRVVATESCQTGRGGTQPRDEGDDTKEVSSRGPCLVEVGGGSLKKKPVSDVADSPKMGANGLSVDVSKPTGRIPVMTLNEDYKSRRDVCCIEGERASHSTFYHRGHSTTRIKQKWSLPSPLSWPLPSRSYRFS